MIPYHSHQNWKEYKEIEKNKEKRKSIGNQYSHQLQKKREIYGVYKPTRKAGKDITKIIGTKLTRDELMVMVWWVEVNDEVEWSIRMTDNSLRIVSVYFKRAPVIMGNR